MEIQIAQIILDEIGCQCDNVHSCTSRCKYLDKKNTTCSTFYFKHQGQCKKFLFYTIVSMNDMKVYSELSEKFKCGNGIQMNKLLGNDLVADCGPNAEDESLLSYSTDHSTIFNCPEPDRLHCVSRHPRCYKISDICHYKLNEMKHLSPCRTGNNLENCEHFECNMKFKCPLYYCIPWS